MTAEPRDVEEIRADLGDLADVLGDLAGMCSTQGRLDARAIRNSIRTRLAADVEPLLARLAAADRENAELRGEVERLRESQFAVGQALVNEQLRSDRAESQLAAAQAQLAEAQRAVGYLLLCHDTSSAKASDWLSAWRTAGAVMARATGYDGPALSAAPQPEPDVRAAYSESLRRLGRADLAPEPVPPARSSVVGGWASDAELAEVDRRTMLRAAEMETPEPHHYSRGYPISHAEHAWDDPEPANTAPAPTAGTNLLPYSGARCEYDICTLRTGHAEAHGHHCVPEGCFECRPPASDEPARCEHDPRCSLNGAAAAGCHCVWHNGRHMACYPSCHAGGGCVEGFPGPAASGAPDGGL